MTATNNPTNQVTFRTVLPHFPNIPANRAVTRTISTQDAAVSAKVPLPESEVEDGHWRATDSFLFLRKAST
jgi:hypothetical protein